MKRETWRHEHDLAEAADLERGGVLSPFSKRCDEILRGMLRNMRREKVLPGALEWEAVSGEARSQSQATSASATPPDSASFPRPHGVLQAEAARAHVAFDAERVVSVTSGLSVGAVDLMERLVASLRETRPDNAPLRFVGPDAFDAALIYVREDGLPQSVEIKRGGAIETWQVLPNGDALRLVPTDTHGESRTQHYAWFKGNAK